MPPFGYETFQALTGRPVTLRASGKRCSGALASVTLLTRHAGHGRQPFSLLIVTDSLDALPQQIFSVEFEGREPVEIFLVPIGPRDGGMGYEAVFS
ncbi:MAG: hypothetical protein RQ729_11135 [Wenzhouxiangellaceae bacterium]|nr:hypothetical protein [Wenzhouxiangellaceae bacterium]